MSAPKSLKVNVVLKIRPNNNFGGGFYQSWLDGTEGGTEFGLAVGAGCGNPLLSFWVEQDGKRVWFDVDVRELIPVLLAQARGEKEKTK